MEVYHRVRKKQTAACSYSVTCLSADPRGEERAGGSAAAQRFGYHVFSVTAVQVQFQLTAALKRCDAPERCHRNAVRRDGCQCGCQ